MVTKTSFYWMPQLLQWENKFIERNKNIEKNNARGLVKVLLRGACTKNNFKLKANGHNCFSDSFTLPKKILELIY